VNSGCKKSIFYDYRYSSLALADSRMAVVNVWQGGRYKAATLLIVTTAHCYKRTECMDSNCGHLDA